MTNDLPDENKKRFIAVLNKKIEMGKLLNALGHMTAGLAGKYENTDDMCFFEYRDKDDSIHPHISHYPFDVWTFEHILSGLSAGIRLILHIFVFPHSMYLHEIL